MVLQMQRGLRYNLVSTGKMKDLISYFHICHFHSMKELLFSGAIPKSLFYWLYLYFLQLSHLINYFPFQKRYVWVKCFPVFDEERFSPVTVYPTCNTSTIEEHILLNTRDQNSCPKLIAKSFSCVHAFDQDENYSVSVLYLLIKCFRGSADL